MTERLPGGHPRSERVEGHSDRTGCERRMQAPGDAPRLEQLKRGLAAHPEAYAVVRFARKTRSAILFYQLNRACPIHRGRP